MSGRPEFPGVCALSLMLEAGVLSDGFSVVPVTGQQSLFATFASFCGVTFPLKADLNFRCDVA